MRRRILKVLGVSLGSLLVIFALGAVAHAGLAVFAGTLQDFHIPGTQVGDLNLENFLSSSACSECHGQTGKTSGPSPSWAGSMMAHAGRDPLWKAQLTTAEQDVTSVGYYCQRCHVPLSIADGNANITDGSALTERDRDGINCHFCHSLVDPIYKPGKSPSSDLALLASLQDPPLTYGNGQFVQDPEGVRRAPRPDARPLHEAAYSPFHQSGDFCGTCHDIGNPEIDRADGYSFIYNTLGEHSTSSDPHTQFPLQRTYSEWKLSSFAQRGVNMAGRFGGKDADVVKTCQDCHMPRSVGKAAAFGPTRKDLRSHEFAGAAVAVLDMIAADNIGNPAVDQAAIARVRKSSLQMLRNAALLKVSRRGKNLKVRVINQSGHKLPTGHSEGRRIWLNVKFLDRHGKLLAEHGAYDLNTATLDSASTVVYEMEMGLDNQAAQLTQLDAGPKAARMSLANAIFKDNRIPPRGFNNLAYSAAGAAVIGWSYKDGQYWDDSQWDVPTGAARALVTLNYQSTPREYIEALRDANVTNQDGQRLYELWTQTGRGAPIEMVRQSISLVRKKAAR
ncbi:MAG: hypothetical protein K1X83_04390 [Oligoflexia bacterium]|nr:hypothetical protein [Oligoflexia bacterium]